MDQTCDIGVTLHMTEKYGLKYSKWPLLILVGNIYSQHKC